MACTILINSALVLESGPEKDVVTSAILLTRKGTVGKAGLLPQALQLVSAEVGFQSWLLNTVLINSYSCRAGKPDISERAQFPSHWLFQC